MKKTLLLAACVLTLAATSSASADLILRYDSTSAGGGGAIQLSEVGTTNTAFVSSADAVTSIDGNGTVAQGSNNTQTQVQGNLALGVDLNFRFGGTSTINYALTPANVNSGSWIGTSFTAAQDMTLDELSFNMFNNRQSNTLYGARDVGLFASLDGGTTFTQFGGLYDSGTTQGQHGTVSFTDSLLMTSGQSVDLRLLFTDKTSTVTFFQAATRVGDIQVFATAVPEPTSMGLFAVALIGLGTRRRRR